MYMFHYNSKLIKLPNILVIYLIVKIRTKMYMFHHNSKTDQIT